MKFSEKALSVFRKEPARLNCAQATCAGAGREDLIESMAACGGGRVEGGTCGALHAAMTIAGPEKAEQVRQAFIDTCGADTCKTLKQELHVSCDKSVSTASDILEDLMA